MTENKELLSLDKICKEDDYQEIKYIYIFNINGQNI